MRSFNLGRRGELPTWRQAESGLTPSTTFGKSEGGEELNHEKARKGLPVNRVRVGAEWRKPVAFG